MTEPTPGVLTREQVEKLKPLADYDLHTVYLDEQRSSLGVFTALAMMIDHDAVQRAAITTLQGQVEALEKERATSRLWENRAYTKQGELEAQLARLQARDNGN